MEKQNLSAKSKINTLVIGGGAREHALVWKFSTSTLCGQIFSWPGNPAINQIATPLDLPADCDFSLLIDAIKREKIDFVFCGPEQPLEKGLADKLWQAGIPVFGPEKLAAQLETSKSFAKKFMLDSGIPTAAYYETDTRDQCSQVASRMIREKGAAVLKADGLAGGKGVFICKTDSELETALHYLYETKLSQASYKVVIEEELKGREFSYFCFIGKSNYKSIGCAVDFKRLKDDDKGPNTGGMGCYTPVPWLPENINSLLEKKIIEPFRMGLKQKNMPFVGCLFVGIMWNNDTPNVIEFNVRLGDPETQVLAASDPSDWLELAYKISLELPLTSNQKPVAPKQSLGVVLASSDYPFGEGELVRSQLPADIFKNNNPDELSFGAAVSIENDKLFSKSGRVITLVSTANSLQIAKENAYTRINGMNHQHFQFRKDIGKTVTSESQASKDG